MGAQTGIEWCHHTFNPWRGCTHVSPGCEHCYAETLAKRNPGQLGTWGAGGTRVVASESMWSQPLRWNRDTYLARAATCECRTQAIDLHSPGCPAGRWERPRVFCASLADVFEDRDDLDWSRGRLFGLIERTPHLDWLLLTKRPENVRLLTPDQWREGWPENIWLGVSVEDQRRADERIPLLLDTPAAVRFLSCEPLLGPVDLSGWLACPSCGYAAVPGHGGCDWGPRHAALDWVIVGGESGPGSRPMDLAWARSLADQCADVPCFVKQLGSWWARDHHRGGEPVAKRDRKGGDPGFWPEDLRVREFPGVGA